MQASLAAPPSDRSPVRRRRQDLNRVASSQPHRDLVPSGRRRDSSPPGHNRFFARNGGTWATHLTAQRGRLRGPQRILAAVSDTTAMPGRATAVVLLMGLVAAACGGSGNKVAKATNNTPLT